MVRIKYEEKAAEHTKLSSTAILETFNRLHEPYQRHVKRIQNSLVSMDNFKLIITGKAHILYMNEERLVYLSFELEQQIILFNKYVKNS
jgi:hypothetical protein